MALDMGQDSLTSADGLKQWNCGPDCRKWPGLLDPMLLGVLIKFAHRITSALSNSPWADLSALRR